MNKKLMKFIKFFSLILVLTILFACVPFGVRADGGSSATVRLYSFETEYERANLVTRYAIGKTVLSNKHVTDGKKSLYAEISGIFPEHSETHHFGRGYEEFVSNYIKISTDENKSFKLKDFSIFDKLSIDIYNDSDRDTHVTVYLQTRLEGSSSKYNGYFSRLGERVLLKDKLNLLDFELEDFRYRGIDDVVAVYFVFDNIEAGQTPLKLYIDNFYGTKATEVNEISKPIRSGNLFSGFEEDYDMQMFTGNVFRMPVDFLPYFEFSTEFKTEGERSLKITVPQTNYYCVCQEWENVNNTWAGFVSYTMKGTLWFNGVNVLEIVGDKDPNNFYVKLDVYNDTDVWQYLTMQNTGIYIAPNSWKTVSIPLTKFEYASGQISNINLSFHEYREEYVKEYYIDNLRLEEGME